MSVGNVGLVGLKTTQKSNLKSPVYIFILHTGHSVFLSHLLKGSRGQRVPLTKSPNGGIKNECN